MINNHIIVSSLDFKLCNYYKYIFQIRRASFMFVSLLCPKKCKFIQHIYVSAKYVCVFHKFGSFQIGLKVPVTIPLTYFSNYGSLLQFVVTEVTLWWQTRTSVYFEARVKSKNQPIYF